MVAPTFALATQGHGNSSDAQEPPKDHSSQLQALPVVVEGTAFINWTIGFQDRQTC